MLSSHPARLRRTPGTSFSESPWMRADFADVDTGNEEGRGGGGI